MECLTFVGYIAITRAMGDHNMKRPGYIHNTPHISVRTLTEANDYLILACDGVWDVVTDQEALELVRKEDHPSCLTKAKVLLIEAKKKGSTDNLTVMVIKL